MYPKTLAGYGAIEALMAEALGGLAIGERVQPIDGLYHNRARRYFRRGDTGTLVRVEEQRSSCGDYSLGLQLVVDFDGYGELACHRLQLVRA